MFDVPSDERGMHDETRRRLGTGSRRDSATNHQTRQARPAPDPARRWLDLDARRSTGVTGCGGPAAGSAQLGAILHERIGREPWQKLSRT